MSIANPYIDLLIEYQWTVDTCKLLSLFTEFFCAKVQIGFDTIILRFSVHRVYFCIDSIYILILNLRGQTKFTNMKLYSKLKFCLRCREKSLLPEHILEETMLCTSCIETGPLRGEPLDLAICGSLQCPTPLCVST